MLAGPDQKVREILVVILDQLLEIVLCKHVCAILPIIMLIRVTREIMYYFLILV